jgi:tetrapyrrole methylase family protein / MazG family protein
MNRHSESPADTKTGEAFLRLFSIIKTLRGPEGCPWDKKQTPTSLAPSLIEESYEFIEAAGGKDRDNMREELGDIFLLVTMISYMQEQNNSFTVSEVLHDISDKLVRRHPHVFGDMKKEDAGEVIELWNQIKRDVENKKEVDSITEEIPRSYPPLERAYKLQKKVSRLGFDWDRSQEVTHKVIEELDELREELKNGSVSGTEEEIGDVLFSLVNLSRFLNIDPAVALHRTNQKFVKRFRYIEEKMKSAGKELSKDNFSLMDAFWNEAKDKNV